LYILGISCYYHDAAAVLLRDGQLVAAAEEERFTRIKHDFNFPKQAIKFCLDQAGIQGADLDYVVFFEKPFRKLDRILMSVLQTYPQSWKVFRESMVTWIVDKLWVASTLQMELGVSKDKILFSEHHLSHAASAYLCSPFDEAAILTVDGVGEWVTATYGVGRGNEIKLHKQMDFPHSLGLLYSAFTAFLGFEVNEGEYKVMGMASYGQPRYVDKVWKVVHQNQDGSFALDMDYFSFHHSTEKTYPEIRRALRGAASTEDAVFHRGDRFSAVFRNSTGKLQRAVGSEPALCGYCGQHSEGNRRVDAGYGKQSSPDYRAEEALHRGRSGPEQRGQHPDLERNPV